MEARPREECTFPLRKARPSANVAAPLSGASCTSPLKAPSEVMRLATACSRKALRAMMAILAWLMSMVMCPNPAPLRVFESGRVRAGSGGAQGRSDQVTLGAAQASDLLRGTYACSGALGTGIRWRGSYGSGLSVPALHGLVLGKGGGFR